MTTSLGSIQELVARLHALPEDDITLDGVSKLVAATDVDDASLAPFLNFRDGRYTRNLVARSEFFDVIVLCWMPGQRTPIHNHSGQRGWVRVVRGALEEVTYETGPGVGAEACALATGGPLTESGRARFAASPAVVTVDEVRAVHRLGNPEAEGGPRAVSLHVYSRPHDSCLTYDADTGAVTRVQLSFDTTPE